jgi:hypothetical protein
MMNAQIGADLDRQQQAINQAIAQDEAQIRAMQEQREMQDISALSSQYNAGQQTMMSGLGGIAQTGLGLATSGIFDAQPRGTQSTILNDNPLNPQGLSSIKPLQGGATLTPNYFPMQSQWMNSLVPLQGGATINPNFNLQPINR